MIVRIVWALLLRTMTKGQPNKLEGNGIGGIDISCPTNVEKQLPVVKFGQCEKHVSGGERPKVQAAGPLSRQVEGGCETPHT